MNKPWIEKYRPVKFENIVLDPLNKLLFNNILKKKYFPNLLFYGPPGTGKTTTIVNLINEYQEKNTNSNTDESINEVSSTTQQPEMILIKPEMVSETTAVFEKVNVIHLNASDERGIDVIRNQINLFVKSRGLFDNGLKFIILDEVDYMTKNAQQALKYLLQTTNYNVRFCLICNYISKIDESLKNELICVKFSQLPRSTICSYIKNICILENIVLEEDLIKSIQQKYNSDIRSMINFIQLNQEMLCSAAFLEKTTENKIDSLEFINDNICNKLHHFLLDSKNTNEEVYSYIHLLSINYNSDKINIIQTYFNYIIRNYEKLIKMNFIIEEDAFLEIVEKIIHSTNNHIHILIYYFIHSLRKIYKPITALHDPVIVSPPLVEKARSNPKKKLTCK